MQYADEEVKRVPADSAPSYPFAAVDSGALVVADVGHLPNLVRLLTWEQYDHGLQDQGDAVIAGIVEALGEPYFRSHSWRMRAGDGVRWRRNLHYPFGRLKWGRG
jgi:hypothetical protein